MEVPMSSLHLLVRRTSLPVLVVLCLAALSISYAFASEAPRPLATQIIGDPDAAVTGKLAVGTATPGNKALTVVGVIDFLGSGTVHNYFTQGAGNNMQINTNVDEANVVGNATKSQWKLVLGSSLDWFSIRRSPAGATYNEDALFFIEGSTGNVGIATVDTNNQPAISFTPAARLHVQTASGDAIRGIATATSGTTYGVYGRSESASGYGVYGSGITYGVQGVSSSPSGYGVLGVATAPTGVAYGVYGYSFSTSGVGVYGWAWATTGEAYGILGLSSSTSGRGVYGFAGATSGTTYGVYGVSYSSSGTGLYGYAASTTGNNWGIYGRSDSSIGAGLVGYASTTTGLNYGVYGATNSPSGYAGYFVGNMAATGSKSAIVETEAYGWRNLYAMESPQNWFEDFGRATLSAGEAVVSIEEIFAETVNLGETYHVFLTPLGNCSLYVADMSSSSFTVRAQEGADCGIEFDYRIIAPRLDYEDLRLKEAEDPEAVAAMEPMDPIPPVEPSAPPSTPEAQ
jgi:hypothetical protein